MRICVSGVDGSGKSTQAKLLETYFRHEGLKTYSMWLRWFSFATYPLYLYARVMKRTIVVKTRSRPVHVHAFWIDRALSRLYPITLLLDVLLRYWVNIVVASIKRVNIVLLDRCFLDVIVDLLWETRNPRFLRGMLALAALSLLRSMYVLVLAAEPRIVARRKSDIVSLKELKFKHGFYKIFAGRLALPLIDTTTLSIFELYKIIAERLSHS